MISLKVDNRETKLKHVLEIENLSVIHENLQYADFVFEVDGNPLLYIERKTTSDLAQSIKDGRYHNQKVALLDNIDRKLIYYIIEGNLSYTESSELYCGVSVTALQSCVINTMIRDDIKVFITKNIDETAALLKNIAVRLIAHPDKYVNSSANEAVSTKYKASVLHKDKFFENMLSQVPGISIKNAKALVKQFESLHNFYELLRDKTDTEKITVLSAIKIEDTKGKHRKISSAVVKNIIEYVF